MNKSFRWILLVLVIAIALSATSVWVSYGNAPSASISGYVFLAGNAGADQAWVRPQTTDNLVYTAQDGSFNISGLVEGITVTLTAWYPGYKTGWVQVVPPEQGVSITLTAYATGDNPAYAWNTSYPKPEAALGCGHCMLPAYDEWQHSAHAAAGTNLRFFSLYNGSNISGTIPIAPGFKLDFPGVAGNCAACHAPGDAFDAPFTTDMNSLSTIGQEGVFCEYCHKIGAVYLDPATGLPYNNTPGVLSTRLYRPYPGDQLFFGSLDDVTRRVSYLPLEHQSQFCAPCHQFSFWGTPIYQSFKEWLDSPYPDQGIECQTCHMPAGESPYFVPPELGGLPRNPQRLASHKDLGLKDPAFMQSAIQMTLSAEMIQGNLFIRVTLTNGGAGHHVPTDHPGRHLLLIVSALDGDLQPLTQLSGPRTPAWAGEQADLPGLIYAKILQDIASGDFPVTSYWKRTRIMSDNRIEALGSATSEYTFLLPVADGPLSVQASLHLRRSPQADMVARGWTEPDVLLASKAVSIPYQTTERWYFPLILR